MQRFSKKRQSILEVLKSTKEHPSAEWIYEKLRPIYPDLSLATVYRNLAQLKAEGAIRSVGIVQGEERFDAATAPHSHAVCIKCGKVIDVTENPTISDDTVEKIRKMTNFEILDTSLQFSGICADCQRKYGTEK